MQGLIRTIARLCSIYDILRCLPLTVYKCIPSAETRNHSVVWASSVTDSVEQPSVGSSGRSLLYCIG